MPAALARAIALLGLMAAGWPCASRAQDAARASTDRRGEQQPAFVPRALSRFALAKAESLVRRRYPCLGCHTLNGEGGRIGPDLSTVGTRRSPAFIYAMLAAPQRTVPGTVMPQVPMPDGTRQLIANYLWQRGAGGREQPVREPSRLPAQPASSLPGAPSSESGATDSAALYAKYCASCHGASGRGDGPNARYLPVAPTAHSSAAYMAQRPDDSLFDAIAAGGYVMNRSHLMPPFGASLTPAQIWSLVGYLRQLCRCVGPPWSRDNQ